MCVVSMIGDHYNDKWKQQNTTTIINDPNAASKDDLNALKKEVEEMKELLKKALDYDKRNNEPHCEMEDKVAVLKRVAEAVGVSLEDVFPKN